MLFRVSPRNGRHLEPPTKQQNRASMADTGCDDTSISHEKGNRKMLTTRQREDSLKARLSTTLVQLTAVRRHLQSRVHPFCETEGVCAICEMSSRQPGFDLRHPGMGLGEWDRIPVYRLRS